MLIQSSTIQRISQRLILCLIVSLSMNLYLRNITQAYVQSATSLNRDFYVQSLPDLMKLMRISDDCVLKVIKSLYEIPEADNHWFKTYHTYHTNQLDMTQFTYDRCLLYKLDISLSDVVNMQTDDTLLLVDRSFAALKKKTIKSAKIMIKNRERFISDNLLKFNETRIERLNKALHLTRDSYSRHSIDQFNRVIYH
jgi:pheromone shutdown protein TraB